MQNKAIIEKIKTLQPVVIDVSKWEEYLISDVFHIEIAKSIDKTLLDEDINGINYITRKSTNNGLEYKVKKIDKLINKGNCISMSMVGANKGSCFYQKNEFMSSQNMLILRNEKLTQNIGMFLINILEKTYRISSDYNAINKNDVLKNKILLPSLLNNITNNYEPDWNYMDTFIDELYTKLNIESISKTLNTLKNIGTEKINIISWKTYKIGDLFEIKGSKTTAKNILEKIGVGEYPYITTTAENQGISGYYNHFTEDGNVLTFDSAVLGTCFYQEKNFSASDHVELGIPKYHFNKKIGLFLQTVINKTNEGVYHYGHKANQKRIRETIIKLPSIFNDETHKYEPDWNYMENYIDILEQKIFN